MNPESNSSLTKVTPLSKALAAIIFIVLPFVGLYIGYIYAPEKVVEVERIVLNHEITNQTEQFITDSVNDESFYFLAYYQGNSLKTDLKEFRDETLGISFSYPAAFGEIVVDREIGECPESFSSDPCEQVYLKMDAVSPHKPDLRDSVGILSLETLGHDAYPPGRGVGWTDIASSYDQNYIEACISDETCDVITNDKNLQIVRTMMSARCIYTCTDLERVRSIGYQYGIHNPDSKYPYIVINPTNFAETFWEDSRIFRVFEETVIQSFELI